MQYRLVWLDRLSGLNRYTTWLQLHTTYTTPFFLGGGWGVEYWWLTWMFGKATWAAFKFPQFVLLAHEVTQQLTPGTHGNSHWIHTATHIGFITHSNSCWMHTATHWIWYTQQLTGSDTHSNSLDPIHTATHTPDPFWLWIFYWKTMLLLINVQINNKDFYSNGFSYCQCSVTTCITDASHRHMRQRSRLMMSPSLTYVSRSQGQNVLECNYLDYFLQLQCSVIKFRCIDVTHWDLNWQ